MSGIIGKLVQWSHFYRSKLKGNKDLKILEIFCLLQWVCPLPGSFMQITFCSYWGVNYLGSGTWVNANSNSLYMPPFGGCFILVLYLKNCSKRVRAFCSQNEPVVWSVFTHILCIFLKSGMHLTLRFIFEMLMSCTDLSSLNLWGAR